jgi:Bacterial PH domain
MQVFTIAPASTRAFWMIGGVVAATLLLLGVLGASAFAARNARFEVSPDGVRLKGDVYGRFIPASELRFDTARRVDFAATPDLVPSRRTGGTGLPGYQAGWFRLSNGEKALVYLTDRNRAVYVGTTAGYGLLLSPADPEGFLAALASSSRR